MSCSESAALLPSPCDRLVTDHDSVTTDAMVRANEVGKLIIGVRRVMADAAALLATLLLAAVRETTLQRDVSLAC